MRLLKSPKDFYAGVLLIGIASIFTAGLGNLPIGTAFRMGPGYFPMVLTILLSAIGATLVVKGVYVKGEPIGGLPGRRLALVILPVAFFGITLKGLGLLPSLGLAVFATTFAGREWTLRSSVLTTATLVSLTYAIFIWGLGLPISMLGPWLGGY